MIGTLFHELIRKHAKITMIEKSSHFTVLLAFLARDHPFSVPDPFGYRYLDVTHRSKKKDAALKRPTASKSQAFLRVLQRS